MGCILSRSSFEHRLEQADANESGQRDAIQIVDNGAKERLQSGQLEGDIERGILISLDKINQLEGAQRIKLGQQIEKLNDDQRDKMSREPVASLKRKLENSRLSSNSAPDGRETRFEEKWNKTSSRTHQLASFISLLINRRKRRSSARIEVANLVPASDRSESAQSLNTDPRLVPLPIGNLEPAMEREAVAKESSSQNGEEALMQSSQQSWPVDEPALLFTSVQQLCYEIINRKLVRQQQAQHKCAPIEPVENLTIEFGAKSHRHHHHHNHSQQTLCLFVFGLQGSSMGELSFELVEHSPLVDFVQNHQQSSQVQDSGTRSEHDCPLYHYIDVSALIVANIDKRIGVYNRLVGQTLRARRRQVEGGQNDQLTERAIGAIMSSSSSSQDDAHEDDEEASRTSKLEIDNDSASLWSTREASISSEISTRVKSPSSDAPRSTSAGQTTELATQCDHHHAMSHDQFGMDTLSTRQRSILQLKLIKYATCVTAKWVTILIHTEIARLEAQLRACLERDSQHSIPKRVYLINSVPNQLSLFRSCLYLQQGLPLNNFRHPFWAIKFERRTNIKVMSKERDTDSLGAGVSKGSGAENRQRRASDEENEVGSPQQENGPNQKLFHMIKLPQIKLPTYLTLRSHSDSNLSAGGGSTTPLSASNTVLDRPRQIEVAASNLLANSVNEKLGPKISGTLANQFRLLNKITRVRYNDMRNYNYATASDQIGQIDPLDCDERRRMSQGNDTATVGTSTQTGQHSCYSQFHTKLSRDNNKQLSGDPNSSPLECPIASPDSNSGSYQQQPLLPAAADDASRPTTLTSCFSNLIDEQHLLLKPDQLERQHLAPSTSPSSIVSNDSSHLSGISWHHSPAALHSRVSPANAGLPSPTNCPKWAIELELIDGQENHANKWYSTSPIDAAGGPTISGVSELLADTSAAAGSLATDFRHTTTVAPINCCLHVYLPPIRRPSSRSPLTLVSSGNGRRTAEGGIAGESRACSNVQDSVCHTGHYYLVATSVAYANGRSQSILEAKTIHKRVVRYSSPRSDSPRLAKLIGKAERQLKADLSSWLRASIENGLSAGQPTGHSATSGNHNHHQHGRHQTAAQQQHKLASNMTPHLVTYTIRVDVAKLLKRALPAQPNCHDLIHDDQLAHNHLGGGKVEHRLGKLSPSDLVHLLQMQPERPALSKRPASALTGQLTPERDHKFDSCPSLRPSPRLTNSPDNGLTDGRAPSSGRQSSSNSAVDVPATTNIRQRHVQFKLNRAPQQSACDDCDSDLHSQAQKRVWIKESLFISCSDKKLSHAIDSFANDLFGQIADGQKQSYGGAAVRTTAM